MDQLASDLEYTCPRERLLIDPVDPAKSKHRRERWMMFSGTNKTERERLEIEGERLAVYEKQAEAEFISVCTTPGASEASVYQAWLVWSRLCDRCLEIERLISALERRSKVPAVVAKSPGAAGDTRTKARRQMSTSRRA